eukprot:gene12195-25619_t
MVIPMAIGLILVHVTNEVFLGSSQKFDFDISPFFSSLNHVLFLHQRSIPDHSDSMVKKVRKEDAKLHERPEFQVVGTPHPDTIHEVLFAIKQNNLDKLESFLHEVSDPDSPKYGEFWTRDEVADLTSNQIGSNKVSEYLTKNNVEVFPTPYGEFITARASISKFEEIFNTKFSIFEHKDSKKHKIEQALRTDEYSIHVDILEHISTVFNVVDLPFHTYFDYHENNIPLNNDKNNDDNSNNNNHHKNEDEDQHQDQLLQYPFAISYAGHVYPNFLKNFYNIQSPGATNLGSQCIYASLKQSFSPADLDQFQSVFNVPNIAISTVTNGYSNDTACAVNSENCIEANLDVQYILAVAPKTPTTYWYDNTGNFATWIKTVSSLKKPPLVHSISYGVSESYSSVADLMTAFNTEAQKLGLQGVTIIAASGDDGAPSYTASYSNIGCKYNPSFPASSPYVTAVGGTQGPESFSDEIACSSLTNGAITTGGGFSTLASAQYFQKQVVVDYFKSLPDKYIPTSGYKTTGRPFPDISILAYNYVVVIGGQQYSVSGTSASAPVFAGMVSLVNSGRLAAGKSALGWINPAIYKYNGSFANDITSGNNKCTRSTKICCSHGFYASTGWDPVTGFGSVDYEKFCKAFQGGAACSSAFGTSINFVFLSILTGGIMFLISM